MPSDKPITAQGLISTSATGRRMILAPDHFSGTVEELATNHGVQNLIGPSAAAGFHKLLSAYLAGSNPLFLIRALGETVRGKIYATNEGNRFKATDNAPAWWIHFALFHEIDLPAASFASIIETLPTHFFEVASQIPNSISSAGWHVAHIFPVKDRNTDYRDWDRKDLVRRCVRNIHPCNYFFIPKADWQLWGGNERVISYFARLYEARYGSVWTEFLSLAGADSSHAGKSVGAHSVPYCTLGASTNRNRSRANRRWIVERERRDPGCRLQVHSPSIQGGCDRTAPAFRSIPDCHTHGHVRNVKGRVLFGISRRRQKQEL